jgi:hypothetical protein
VPDEHDELDQIGGVEIPRHDRPHLIGHRTGVSRLVDRGQGGTLEGIPVQYGEVATQRRHLGAADVLRLGQRDVMRPLVTGIEAVRRAQDHQLAQAPGQPAGEKRATEAQPTAKQLGLVGQGGEQVHRFLGATRGRAQQTGQALIPLIGGNGLDAGWASGHTAS